VTVSAFLPSFANWYNIFIRINGIQHHIFFRAAAGINAGREFSRGIKFKIDGTRTKEDFGNKKTAKHFNVFIYFNSSRLP